MAIVFSAITPHSPILIPQIGKDNLSQLKQTLNSFNKLQRSLIKSGAETILLISPHGTIQADAFSINLSPKFSCNFEDFGDFATRKTWTANIGLIHKLKESLETKAPLQLISDPDLDYGTAVPLYLLTKKIPNIKVIPLYYSGLDKKAHFKFGQLIKKELLKRREPVAVIASGDLSHRLDKIAPGGYAPRAKKFDAKISKYLLEKKTDRIIDIDHKLIMEAGECGLKSILILLGILDNINYKPHLLSYEHPFGVGYLTMNMEL
jgi:aromatic ring-opening dioxygenase LigB subunit